MERRTKEMMNLMRKLLFCVILVGAFLLIFSSTGWSAGQFQFDDGTLQGWTMDGLRDGNGYYYTNPFNLSWDDSNQYPEVPNNDTTGDNKGTISATGNVYLPGWPADLWWFIDLISPDVSSDTLWQNITGLSAKVRGDGVVNTVQFILKTTRISDGEEVWLSDQNSDGWWIFHDINTDNQTNPFFNPFNWANFTPRFGDLSGYVIKNIIIRVWGIEKSGFGQINVDNVTPTSGASTVGLLGAVTAGFLGEACQNYIDIIYESDFSPSVEMTHARIDFTGTAVTIGGMSPCTEDDYRVTNLVIDENDQIMDFDFSGFDPGERFRLILDLDLGGTYTPVGCNYVGATVELTFDGLPDYCTNPLTGTFVRADTLRGTASFSCGNQGTCTDNDSDTYAIEGGACGPIDCNDGNGSINPGATESCDGVDNDCNGETEDGSEEPWLGAGCDGPDSDLCEEGTYSCTGGAQTCSDTSGDDLEVCDGLDNDCNGATADGSDEPWLGAGCDGPDSDLCEEGTYSCTGGAQTCSDTSGNNLEVCDGLDNDCNGATADGSDEAWLGAGCDGPDSDLCEEGTYSCTGGAQTCSDTSGDNLEVCDGLDNDCNGATADGSDEPWIGDPTNCGTGVCASTGQLLCSGGSQVDTCTPGTPTETPEVSCSDGLDNDCDGFTDGADPDCPVVTCIDNDGDGYGDPGDATCPNGGARDCDDGDNTIYPFAPEPRDGIDNDCDGEIDEGTHTPEGPNVEVCDPDDPDGVCVTFGEVTEEGDTTIIAEGCQDSIEGLNLTQMNPLCVQIDTDATFEEDLKVEICIPYDDTGVDERYLAMVRCPDGDPNNCELLKPCEPDHSDTDENILCACTDRFSYFAVGTPLDSDEDGTPDLLDNCPHVQNWFQENADGDDIGDACDNCWHVPNPGQEDTDGSCSAYAMPYTSDPQCGDACEFCEGDFDNDGDVDGSDLAELAPNPGLLDLSSFVTEFGRIDCALPGS